MDTKQKYSDIIKLIHDKATCGFASKENEEEKAGEEGAESEAKEGESKLKPSNLEKDSKSPRKLNKKITIPEPFNLSVNKPKILQEPNIENERKNRLEIIKKNIIERTVKDRNLYTMESDNRPKNLEKIREEVENEIQKTLQFNNKYCTPLKDFSKFKGDVKYNETAIIREEYLIDKKNKEEQAALNKILIEKKDSKEFDRWVAEMKIRDDIVNLTDGWQR